MTAVVGLLLGLGFRQAAHAATHFADSNLTTVDTRYATTHSADSNLTRVDTRVPGLPVTIAGRVWNAAGRPVGGARITAKMGDQLAATATTELATGAYTLPALPSGVYQLEALFPGTLADRRTVWLGPTTTVQDFRLRPATVGLAVVEEAAVPLPELLQPLHGSGDGSRWRVFDGTRWVTDRALRPDLPTVVFTHGWQPCVPDTADPAANGINGWPRRLAQAMASAGVTGELANLVAWDWHEAARPCYLGPITPPPEGVAPDQGLALGQALYANLGPGYAQRLHFLGHSLGTLVNSCAADYLHGYVRAQYPVAVPHWESERTQMTLFDEAAISPLVSVEALASGALSLRAGVQAALISYGLAASQWKDPVPHDFKWLENYVSCVGRNHPAGVNILLQRPAWDGITTNKNYVANSVNILTTAHGYPMQWYAETVTYPPAAGLGWHYSLEWSAVSPPGWFPPAGAEVQPGTFWKQQDVGDTHSLEPAEPIFGKVPPGLVAVLAGVGRLERDVVTGFMDTATSAATAVATGVVTTMDWVGTQLQDGTKWVAGQGRKAGEVTVEFVEDTSRAIGWGTARLLERVQNNLTWAVDTYERTNLRLKLQTGILSLRPGPRLAGVPTMTNQPAYFWLPVLVPPGADYAAFDFTAAGDGAEDSLVFGLNGVNVFSLAAKHIPTHQPQVSQLIDISAYAGKTNEIFFGIVGGTSTNCTITVDNLRFFSIQPPSLSITKSGNALAISWPSSGDDYALDVTSDLESGKWQAVTNLPSLFGGRYFVTNGVSEQARFFRLRGP